MHTFDIAGLVSATLFNAFLVFCRIGSAFLLAPGIGDIIVPAIIRLLFALAITVFMNTALVNAIDVSVPENAASLLFILASEVGIGLYIGLIGRILFYATHTAGLIIASSTGLSAAAMFDQTQGTQSGVIANFLGIIVMTLIINLNLHILLIRGFATSYDILPIGHFFSHYAEFSEIINRAVSIAWKTGVEFAAPFIISGLVVYLGAGVLGRLIPQIQVFFLILPAQVLVGIFILTLTVAGMLKWFIEQYQLQLSNLFGL